MERALRRKESSRDWETKEERIRLVQSVEHPLQEDYESLKRRMEQMRLEVEPLEPMVVMELLLLLEETTGDCELSLRTCHATKKKMN